MKVLSNLEFKNSTYILNKFTDFPENPSEGTVIFKENGLYIYSTNITSGSLEWLNILDFTRVNTSYKFEQTSESTEWVIEHNLNTQDLFVIVYDSEGNKQIESEIQFQSDNEIKLIFSEAISGKALLFGASVVSSPSNMYTKEEIDDLLKNIDTSGSNSNSGDYNFSTEERIIGTWIDGKSIYRRTLQVTSPDTLNTYKTIYDCSDFNIELVTNLFGIMIGTPSSGKFNVTINYYYGNGETGHVGISTYYDFNSHSIKMAANHQHYINNLCYINIEYIKTTN